MPRFEKITSRERMERLLANAQLRPELRENYRGYTIFVGDGFSEKPHVHFQRFGVEKEDFDNGAFCSMWLIGEGDNIRFGSGLLFDKGHDPHLASEETRKQARLRKALTDAVNHVDMLEKAKKEASGKVLHA